LPSELAQIAQKLKLTEWPAPVVRLFLGQAAPAAALAAADKTKRYQVREAYVYSGEWALLEHKQEEAQQFFKSALANCEPSLDWATANMELRNLGGRP
jgi:lipoprotein NlpI